MERLRIGEWVRRQRAKRGWSQPELAREFGTDPGTISRWERGKRVPELEMFRRLCALFGERADKVLEIVDLATGDKKPKAPKAAKKAPGGAAGLAPRASAPGSRA